MRGPASDNALVSAAVPAWRRHPRLLGLCLLFLLGTVVASVYMLWSQVDAAEQLRNFTVVATHFSSVDCADSFSRNEGGGASMIGPVVMLLTCLLLTAVAVLIVILPRRFPGCVGCINVGTPEMKKKLMTLAAAGDFDVVEHVMLVLATYLMFLCPLMLVLCLPLFESSGRWNRICLANIQCSAQVQLAYDREGPQVCCSDFELSCGSSGLFWLAIVALCIGPLVPLPCILTRVSRLLQEATSEKHGLLSSTK